VGLGTITLQPRTASSFSTSAVPTRLTNVSPTDGFVCAGIIGNRGLNLQPGKLSIGRTRHQYGDGPLALLIMPPLPDAPGLYLWQADDEIVYVGQTRTQLKKRLGSNGYSMISTYNTFAREPGRRNGGQQTNCRVNALANEALAAGRRLQVWYRTTEDGQPEEAEWMATFGLPTWNRRLEPAPSCNLGI